MTLKLVIKLCQSFQQEMVTQIHGFFVVVTFLAFVFLCFPIYLYRWGLTLVAKLFFAGKIGNIVTAFANAFTVDFLPKSRHNPKAAIVTKIIFDGKLEIKEVEKVLASRWLEESSGLAEFKQYVEPWMGFMFWKVDTEFELKNHLKLHNFQNKSEQEFCLFVEELLNKPFPVKRSPWECHVIQNYPDKVLSSKCSEGEMTGLVFRFHHCMADGYSVMYALVEKLGGIPLSEIGIPPKKNEASLMSKLLINFTFPFRLFSAISNYAALFNSQHKRVSFGATEEVKKGGVIYDRCAAPVSIKIIKEIKNKFGVNFNTVLLAGLAAGLTESVQTLEKKRGTSLVEKGENHSILFLAPLPLPGHPKKLRNHITGTYMELPTSPELDPMQRLKIIETEFERAKNSMIPFILPWLIKAVGSLFVNMSTYMLNNRVMQAGFSNFVGPAIPMQLAGKMALTTDFVTGSMPGVSAASLFLLSFGDAIHITAAVESGVFDRSELKAMMKSILREFEILHELSKEIK